MSPHTDKIDAAYKSLKHSIEVAKVEGDWTPEVESAQMIALSDIEDAGYDWEADEDLMRYCLKATDVEAAEATLLHFTRWVEAQQLADDDDEEPDLDHYCERKVILAERAQRPVSDDTAARAQQVAADVAAQDGLDAEESAAMEQCMMDMLEQEGEL